jgi:hypothetical protein
LQTRSKFEPEIDLLEVRRQLIAMRSRHSHDRSVTRRINALLGELAYLREPNDRRHEKRLVRMITKTMATVERIVWDR